MSLFKQRAYTLLEVLMVMALIALFAAMSMPSLQGFIEHASDALIQSQITQTIERARTEVKSRGWPVSICHTKSNVACDGEWRDGLLVFVDRLKLGTVQTGDDIIAATQLHTADGVLYWRAYPVSHPYIRMVPDQLVAVDNGMFWYCHSLRKWPAFAVAINRTGLVRVLYPDHQGEIRDSRGTSLVCA